MIVVTYTLYFLYPSPPSTSFNKLPSQLHALIYWFVCLFIYNPLSAVSAAHIGGGVRPSVGTLQPTSGHPSTQKKKWLALSSNYKLPIARVEPWSQSWLHDGFVTGAGNQSCCEFMCAITQSMLEAWPFTTLLPSSFHLVFQGATWNSGLEKGQADLVFLLWLNTHGCLFQHTEQLWVSLP